MPNILVVEDHPLFREALGGTIRQAFADSTVVEADDIESAVSTILANKELDLVLLDLKLPDASGFGGLLTLRTRFPKLPVVIVSGTDDRRIVTEALSYGVVGFIPKSAPKAMLRNAIVEALEGGVFLPPGFTKVDEDESDGSAGKRDTAKRISSLTPQQFRVLQMLNEGKLNKQIAYELDVGETTVKAHVSAILRKLKVYSRTQAVLKAREIEEDFVETEDKTQTP